MKSTPELIEWVDSYGCSSSWTSVAEISEIPAVHCFSVGFVLAETDEYLVIAPHWHEGNEKIGSSESACGEMAIPICSIVNRRRLQ